MHIEKCQNLHGLHGRRPIIGGGNPAAHPALAAQMAIPKIPPANEKLMLKYVNELALLNDVNLYNRLHNVASTRNAARLAPTWSPSISERGRLQKEKVAKVNAYVAMGGESLFSALMAEIQRPERAALLVFLNEEERQAERTWKRGNWQLAAVWAATVLTAGLAGGFSGGGGAGAGAAPAAATPTAAAPAAAAPAAAAPVAAAPAAAAPVAAAPVAAVPTAAAPVGAGITAGEAAGAAAAAAPVVGGGGGGSSAPATQPAQSPPPTTLPSSIPGSGMLNAAIPDSMREAVGTGYALYQTTRAQNAGTDPVLSDNGGYTVPPSDIVPQERRADLVGSLKKWAPIAAAAFLVLK